MKKIMMTVKYKKNWVNFSFVFTSGVVDADAIFCQDFLIIKIPATGNCCCYDDNISLCLP